VNRAIDKIMEIFLPWVMSKRKDLKIKSLYNKIERKNKDYKTKHKYLDKIFSNLNIKFENLLENYLNNSINYVSLNSEKIINDIKENLIIPESLINKENNNHKTIVSYETIKHESQFYGNDKNKNLLIFITGNDLSSLNNKESVKKIINETDNFDSLYLSIFNRGINLKYRSEISFNGLKENINSNLRDNYILKSHNILNYYQGDNNKINPMSLFLSGNYYLIKDTILKKNYDKIFLIGLSNGSVPTLFYGTLFEEIDSISTFDGVVPLTSHYFSSELKKYFYFYDNKFFEKYDYDILYFIMLLNKKTKKNLNMFFSDSYWNKNKKVFKNLMDKFNFTNFVMENNLKEHDFDADIVLDLIRKKK
jgi:hypothetical protein